MLWRQASRIHSQGKYKYLSQQHLQWPDVWGLQAGLARSFTWAVRFRCLFDTGISILHQQACHLGHGRAQKHTIARAHLAQSAGWGSLASACCEHEATEQQQIFHIPFHGPSELVTTAAAMCQVPSGLLPAMELDGEIIIESADVMAALEYAFPDRPLMPAKGSPAHARATGLMKLERRLFGAWLQWLCYPRSGLCPGPSLTFVSCPLHCSLDHLPVRHAGMLL